MKILFSFEYSLQKIGYGGGQQILLGLASGLSELGHQVTIISSGVDEVGARKRLPNCTIHTTIFCINRYLINPIVVGLYSSILIAFKRPKAVIGFGGESVITSMTCRIFGINFYSFLAAPDLPEFGLQSNRKKNANLLMQFLAIKNAKYIFSLSDYLTSKAIKNWGISPDKLIKVGSGIDKVFLSNEIKHHSSILCKNKFNILTIGRIYFEQKPLDILCKVVALLKDRISCWTIVGSGSDMDALREQAEKLGISNKVKFLGTLNSECIKEQLFLSDIVVLPSNSESLMLTAYEAISMCRITVLNDVADLKRDFENFDSVLVLDKADEKSLFDGLHYAMDHYTKLNSKVEDASIFVRDNMNWTSCAKIVSKQVAFE